VEVLGFNDYPHNLGFYKAEVIFLLVNCIFDLDLRIVARQDMFIKRQETADKHKLKGFFNDTKQLNIPQLNQLNWKT
jgi:hypothetical protein